MTIKLRDLCGRDTSLRFSPHCWKARMALKHKGLEFESIATPFTAIGKIGADVKTIPVMEDGEHTVKDSFDIATYLDDAYPDRPPLFGHDSVVAAARLIEGWSISAIHPIVGKMIIKDIHDVLDEPDQAYFRQSREPRLGKSIEDAQSGVEAETEALTNALFPVRRMLQHHDFIGGAKPLFADYIVLGPLMWLMTIHGSVPLAGDDPVSLWFQRCLDLHDGYAAGARRAA